MTTIQLAILSVSFVFGGGILAFEVLRRKTLIPFDFISGVGFLFFVCFVVVPIYGIGFGFFERAAGGAYFRQFSERQHLYLIASLCAVLGYIFVVWGFYQTSHLPHCLSRWKCKGMGDDVKGGITAGSILLCMGGISLLIYVSINGGLQGVLSTNTRLDYTGHSELVASDGKWVFTQTLARFVLFSSYCLFGVMIGAFARRRFGLGAVVGFGIACFGSVILLIILGGRLGTFMFFSTLVLGVVFFRQRRSIVAPILLGVGGFVLVFFYRAFVRSFFMEDALVRSVEVRRGYDILEWLDSLLIEFAFPYSNVAHSITLAHGDFGFRYFSDVWIAILQLIPRRLFDVQFIPLSNYNTHFYGATGTIPVDLVSFGYFSLGPLGIIIVCFLFGKVGRWTQMIFYVPGRPVFSMLVAFWVVYLSFRVMYGDPSLIARPAVPAIISTFVLFYCTRGYPLVEGYTQANGCGGSMRRVKSGSRRVEGRTFS